MSRAKTRPESSLSVKAPDSISQELTNLPAVVDSVTRVTEKEEESALDRKKQEGIRKLSIQNDLLQAQLNKINNDNEARKTHSLLIFIMVFLWLIGVLVILILTGTGCLKLPEKVLITLLGTTSINVIGLLVIVANYLFNKSKST